MTELYVGDVGEFEEGTRKLIASVEAEIGIFRIRGSFYAFQNSCAHQGGPVCRGKIIPRVEEDLAADKTSRGRKFSRDKIHIICPWHGYEFDIETGVHPGDDKVFLKKYEVVLRDNSIFVVV